MTRILAALALLCTFSFAAAPSWAQEKDEPECLSKKLEYTEACVTSEDLLGKLDLAVPENALFALLGSTPETIIRPKVGDKFATSVLPQVVDALGNEQYALAIEVNPGLQMMPKSFPAEALTDGKNGVLAGARFWSQFTISAATSRATGDNTITQYGVGANFNHDTGAPLFANGRFGKCVSDLDANIVTTDFMIDVEAKFRDGADTKHWYAKDAQGRPTAVVKEEYQKIHDDELLKRVDEAYANARPGQKMPTSKEATDRCAKQFTRWNRNMYGGGVAFYNSETDPVNSTVVPSPPSTSESGYGAWVTASFALGSINPLTNESSGIDPDGQFTISARYTDNLVRERKDGDEKITETVDGWRVGARFTHSFSSNEDEEEGSKSDAFRAFVEIAYNEEKFSDIKDHFTQAGIGFEVQVAKDVYLQAVIGDTMSSKIDRSTYFTGQLKWSFSNGLAK